MGLVSLLRIVIVAMMPAAIWNGGTAQAATIDAVTYAGARTILFVPAREACRGLGLSVRYDGTTNGLYIDNRRMENRTLRRLPNSTILLPVHSLTAVGATVTWDGRTNLA